MNFVISKKLLLSLGAAAMLIALRPSLILTARATTTPQDPAQKDDKDKDEKEKKPEKLPIEPKRKIPFTTDEGTWMTLDVSPDGKQIVFDILGDLYLLPIAGGEAKALTTGMPWDCQPRFSPDGKQIAFISDKTGSDNIWLINTDGSNPKQVTKETDFLLG
jgi:Tol biopolymer transport system component